jgi:hypothetical protein
MLSTTLQAISFFNKTLPIRRLATIRTTSSFDIEMADTESYTIPLETTQEPVRLSTSRGIDLRVSRPGEARAFTILLFAAAWILAHVNVGLVVIAKRHMEAQFILKYLVSAGVVFLAVPQLRNSMPDAPGLDGKVQTMLIVIMN